MGIITSFVICRHPVFEFDRPDTSRLDNFSEVVAVIIIAGSQFIRHCAAQGADHRARRVFDHGIIAQFNRVGGGINTQAVIVKIGIAFYRKIPGAGILIHVIRRGHCISIKGIGGIFRFVRMPNIYFMGGVVIPIGKGNAHRLPRLHGEFININIRRVTDFSSNLVPMSERCGTLNRVIICKADIKAFRGGVGAVRNLDNHHIRVVKILFIGFEPFAIL